MLTFLGDRISETISGETAAVVVNLFGDDLDVLDAKAARGRGVLAGGAGRRDVQLQATSAAPRLVDPAARRRARAFRLPARRAARPAADGLQGTVVAQTHRGNETADVVVILDPDARRDPETIGALLVRSAERQP